MKLLTAFGAIFMALMFIKSVLETDYNINGDYKHLLTFGVLWIIFTINFNQHANTKQ